MNAKQTERQATVRGFRIRGRVQGVGFRWWTRAQALRLGLEGTVRNCEDGTVEVWTSGDPAAVAELRRLLEAGPAGSDVQDVAPLAPRRSWSGEGFQVIR